MSLSEQLAEILEDAARLALPPVRHADGTIETFFGRGAPVAMVPESLFMNGWIEKNGGTRPCERPSCNRCGADAGGP